jgi:hypothetical protein
MSEDLTERATSLAKPEPKSETKPEHQQHPTGQATTGRSDTASRVKHTLMSDIVGRMLGKDAEKPNVEKPGRTGTPRVILALAHHGRSPGWGRAKTLQRQLFAAAADQRPSPGDTNCVGANHGRNSGLEMKFAFYGPDNAKGVRPCRITARWITDPGDMAATIDRVECNCGCYVNIRNVLEQAVEEATNETGGRPLRAVIIAGDAFHDDQDGLDEAAISANQLRKMGTRVFLLQLGDDPATAHRLQYLARVSDSAYFQFDPRTQERQFAEMFAAVSAYTAGGEEAVRASVRGSVGEGGGQAANLLLEHLQQTPLPPVMPIIETREQATTSVSDGSLQKAARSRS